MKTFNPVYSDPVAFFPGAVWDSSSESRPADRTINREPLYEDWDQAVSEILAVETYLTTKDLLTLTNDNAGALVEGATVYVKSNGHIDKANAAAASTSTLVGIVESSGGIGIGAAGVVRTGGLKTFSSTANVDAVFGTTGGFTPGVLYYVSDATAGKGTSTAPSTSTHLVWLTGLAITATQIQVRSQYQKTN